MVVVVVAAALALVAVIVITLVIPKSGQASPNRKVKIAFHLERHDRNPAESHVPP